MPELSISRPRALAAAGLLVVALVVAGRVLVGAGAARSPADELAAAPAVRAEAPPPVVVHVVGAVTRPGLYRLARGERVADAVERAGGALAAADLALINLAAPVADGQQVVVPARGLADAGASGGTGAVSEGKVSLSSATVEQLDALPGVGPVTAQKIVDYREQHGAFASVRELDAVPGIGPARLAQLEELVVP